MRPQQTSDLFPTADIQAVGTCPQPSSPSSISRREIEAVLADNEIIEVYEQDDRVRYVLLGHVGQRPLHVVAGQDDIINATVVISVYEPDDAHGWDSASGVRNRKEDADDR